MDVDDSALERALSDPDVLLLIFRALHSASDVASAAAVSKAWHRQSSDSDTWRQLYCARFAAAAYETPPLAVGSAVVIRGLASRPELNNQVHCLHSFSNDRWAINIGDEEWIRVRPSNLTPFAACWRLRLQRRFELPHGPDAVDLSEMGFSDVRLVKQPSGMVPPWALANQRHDPFFTSVATDHGGDTGHVVLRAPLPLQPWDGGDGIGYFEAIVDGSSVGLSRGRAYEPREVNAEGVGRSHLGWRRPSYGYHSDDGTKWRNDRVGTSGFMGETWGGAAWSRGAIIGCGLDFVARRISFTKDGVLQGVSPPDAELSLRASVHVDQDQDQSVAGRLPRPGVAFGDVDSGELYPTVTLHEAGDRARFNFGRAPFRFDVASFLRVCPREA